MPFERSVTHVPLVRKYKQMCQLFTTPAPQWKSVKTSLQAIDLYRSAFNFLQDYEVKSHPANLAHIPGKEKKLEHP